ncbi:LysR family transcriptional regulator [Cystobacter fuscus]|uniref:LysR family transcriptional regulator n=1 Tax=Cystobacter fuscus TaxID=43 RepID=A0A250J8T7_9BACT|nr:LysR family transcriptional regulator [Cystobacter fuscus]ATB39960.1 LysR family transcriptional regulator [Cystobacter fuscus]
MRGPEFADLSAFEAVATHRSFARAAQELRTTAPVLSVTVRRLETRLGVRLLNRTTRSVSPTEAGLHLLQRLRPALRELDAAVLVVEDFRDRPVGTVKINSAHSAAVSLIAPVLGEFFDRHPEVKVELSVNSSTVDLAGGGYDLGVRLGERLEKDMVALRLGGRRQVYVVASPKYLRTRGTPQTPFELKHHRCIGTRRPDGIATRWEFERRGKNVSLPVDGTLVVDNLAVQLRAAQDGAGLAYTIDDSVEPLLVKGKLVRVLETWSPRFDGFYLTYPSRRQLTGAVRSFIDFMTRR